MIYKLIATKYVCIILLSVVFSNTLIAQNSVKQEKLKQLFKPHTHEHNYGQYLKNSHNEIEATAALLFLGYKSFLSSQDMNSCVFSPSCSVYAIQSLQHDNPVKAYLKIFDRLTRCHPAVGKGEYPLLKNSNLYYDPVF